MTAMTATSNNPAPRRALLVVADGAMHRLCRQMLSDAGWAVINGIESGAAAVTAAREQRPEVIFLSQQLNDVPALEAVKWLRSNTELATTPIIILGGNVSFDHSPSRHQITVLPRPVTAAHIRYALAQALPGNVTNG
jgi:DNA-binding response OmpR family regulator